MSQSSHVQRVGDNNSLKAKLFFQQIGDNGRRGWLQNLTGGAFIPSAPDDEFGDGFPGSVREWCINSAAVDPFSHSVLANSEDGRLYRWDLATNTLAEAVTLTAGVGEAYTPTVIGPDGKVYAINNSILFAVGAAP